MTYIAIWHGTEHESFALREALKSSCTCPPFSVGDRHCAAHAMVFDQRVVDGLLFMRRIAERLIVEEFAVPSLSYAGGGATME